MALLKVEAEKLSNNDLQRGVIEEIITHDDVFQIIPFMKTDGKAYVYNRENSESQGTFLDPNDSVVEEAVTFTNVVATLKILAGDVDVDKFLSETMSDTNEQLAIQIALKAKGLGRKWSDTFINGDEGGSPKEFDGLGNLVTVAQTLTGPGANGDALTLSFLDQLEDEVPNGPRASMRGPSRTLRPVRRRGRPGRAPRRCRAAQRGLCPRPGPPSRRRRAVPGRRRRGPSPARP